MSSSSEARGVANLVKDNNLQAVGERLAKDCIEHPGEFQELLMQVKKENADDLARNKYLPAFLVADGQVSISSPGQYWGNLWRNNAVVFFETKSGSHTEAPAGATVVDQGGSHVKALTGSTVFVESGSSLAVQPGSTIYVDKGADLVVPPGSSVEARAGSSIISREGSIIAAPNHSPAILDPLFVLVDNNPCGSSKHRVTPHIDVLANKTYKVSPGSDVSFFDATRINFGSPDFVFIANAGSTVVAGRAVQVNTLPGSHVIPQSDQEALKAVDGKHKLVRALFAGD